MTVDPITDTATKMFGDAASTVGNKAVNTVTEQTRGLFTKADGSINWRTIVLMGAGVGIGVLTGGAALGVVAGGLLGAGGGLVAAFAANKMIPDAPQAPVVAAPAPGAGNAPAQAGGASPEVVPPQNIPGQYRPGNHQSPPQR